MNAIPRLLLLSLLVMLACANSLWAQSGGDIKFFPDNPGAQPKVDFYSTGFVVRNARDAKTRVDSGFYFFPVNITTGSVKKPFIVLEDYDGPRAKHTVCFTGEDGSFVTIPAQQFFPPGAAPAKQALPQGGGASGVTSIPVSNSADSFDVTCDGRFAVVVGNGPGPTFAAPVSLVDLAAGREVDTLPSSGRGNFVAACDDGESVLVLINAPSNETNSVRRLKIVDGKLVDTGESLAAGPAGTEFFTKVFAVPGSKVGIALGQFGAPHVAIFSIPGLQVLDSVNVGGDSAAVSCAGDKIYLRGYTVQGGGYINGYTLDPVTGALGDTPFLTFSVGHNGAVLPFGNALAISQDGTLLIVPEGTEFPNSPPTPRVSFFDTTTGNRLDYFEEYQGQTPQQVATIPCCAPTVVGTWAERTVVRSLPTAVGTGVDIGTLTFTGGTGTIEAAVNATGTDGWSLAKRYVIPIRNNLGNGSPPNTWLKVLPTHDTGPYAVNNFDLDINVSNATVLLRLRTVGSSGGAATARIAIKTTGLQTFANSAATAAVTVPAQTLAGNAVNEMLRKAGVGIAPSGSALIEVNGGDTRGLRLRPRSTPGAPTTGKWSKGTIILDSAAKLFICTAGGTPGTWKKVGL